MGESLENVRLYIENGTYPEDADKAQKRRIREKSSSFKVQNGDMFYVGRKKESRL